jgi:hypothetical protein
MPDAERIYYQRNGTKDRVSPAFLPRRHEAAFASRWIGFSKFDNARIANKTANAVIFVMAFLAARVVVQMKPRGSPQDGIYVRCQTHLQNAARM